jgi:hypothetical protein
MNSNNIEEINTRYYEHILGQPVKSVLQISFNKHGNGVSVGMRMKLIEMLTNGVDVPFAKGASMVKLDLLALKSDFNVYTIRAGYQHIVQYFAIKHVVDQINEEWKDSGVSMNFLLSQPMIFPSSVTVNGQTEYFIKN